MRHADDGTLHALLDGALGAESPERAAEVEAHLETCADCRARLDAAAALRDRAGFILGAIEPATAVPDFGEVLARREAVEGVGVAGAAGAGGVGVGGEAGGASAARDRFRRRTRLTRGLAWAASLVVALGTGYLIGQEFAFDPGAGVADRAEAGETAPPPRSAGGEAAEEEGGQGGPTPAEAFATAAAPADGGDVEGPAASDGAGRAAPGGREEVAAPVAAPPAAGAVRDGTSPTVEESPRARTAQEPESPAQDRAESVPAKSLATEGTEGVAGQVQTMAEARRLMEPAAAVEAADVEAAAPHRIQVRAAPGRNEVADPSALLTDDATTWAEVTVDRARALLDGELLVLPDAEVRSTRVAASGAVVAVESVQALPGEIFVQVRQIRGLEGIVATGMVARDRAANPSEAGEQAASQPQAAGEPEPAGEPGTAVVSIDAGSYRLVVRGPLSPEALRALALQARPQPPR